MSPKVFANAGQSQLIGVCRALSVFNSMSWIIKNGNGIMYFIYIEFFFDQIFK